MVRITPVYARSEFRSSGLHPDDDRHLNSTFNDFEVAQAKMCRSPIHAMRCTEKSLIPELDMHIRVPPHALLRPPDPRRQTGFVMNSRRTDASGTPSVPVHLIKVCAQILRPYESTKDELKVSLRELRRTVPALSRRWGRSGLMFPGTWKLASLTYE